MAELKVTVAEADFDIAVLQRELLQGQCSEGAIATFTGYVRSENNERDVFTLELEHYPGMTERSIGAILSEAAERWSLRWSRPPALPPRQSELRP